MERNTVDMNPACGRCGSTMSDRNGNQYFCPRCAEYDRNLPTIYPEDPEHPGFEQRFSDDPTVIVGYELVKGIGDDIENVGTIVEYEPRKGQFIIETDLNEPFELTRLWISRTRLTELMWFPDPGSYEIPRNEDRSEPILWLE